MLFMALFGNVSHVDTADLRRLCVVLASFTGWSLAEIGDMDIPELLEWVDVTQEGKDER